MMKKMMILKKKKKVIAIVSKKKKVIDSKEEEENDWDSKEEEVVNNSKKKKITHKMQFIDSYRLMPSKLSDLADSLFGIFNKECISCKKRKKIIKMRFYWI